MYTDESDNNNIVWGLLSFFLPIVGFILAIVWWRERHSNAKVCLIWASVPVVLMVLAMVGSLIFATVALSNGI